MTDRELMQQALEALNHVNVQDRVQIITALRERLAQPEREPVAWVNQANLNSAAIQRNRGGQGDTHTWSETPSAYHPVPLYTAPPQRKPLTDEECDNLWAAQLVDITDRFSARDFIRDVEAAHGIKEST